MTIKSLISVPGCILPLLALTLLISCVKDGLNECGTDCRITVRAFDADGRELTRNEVTSVDIYVFDGNSKVAGTYRTQIRETVDVGICEDDNLLVVAWGNLDENSIPVVGDHIQDCRIDIKTFTRSNSYSGGTDDLFFGSVTINKQEQPEIKELDIYRKTGSMTVTARNLKEFAGFDDGNYSVLIRETGSGIGFDGVYTGGKVSYIPAGNFTTKDGREHYYVPPFNIIPEPSGLFLDFYHGADLVASISGDGKDNPITVIEGKLTNVLVDFRNSIEVEIKLTDWGDEYVGKEF